MFLDLLFDASDLALSFVVGFLPLALLGTILLAELRPRCGFSLSLGLARCGGSLWLLGLGRFHAAFFECRLFLQEVVVVP